MLFSILFQHSQDRAFSVVLLTDLTKPTQQDHSLPGLEINFFIKGQYFPPGIDFQGFFYYFNQSEILQNTEQ